MDHLSATLKRGGVKDLLAFFPPNKRDGKYLEEHFRNEALPQVADWWAKKQYAVVKEGIIKDLSEMLEGEDTTEQVIAAIRTRQEESNIPESELILCIWQGLMGSVDWSARPDQIEGLALREVTVSNSSLLVINLIVDQVLRNLHLFWSHSVMAVKLKSL